MSLATVLRKIAEGELNVDRLILRDLRRLEGRHGMFCFSVYGPDGKELKHE